MDIANELKELSRNLWWCWNTDSIAMFRDLDPDVWRRVNHNPIAFLAEIPPDQLASKASELALDSRINYMFHRLQEYTQSTHTWGDVHGGPLRVRPVAYFSAEFGLHESLPIYSGGLGILAGDTIKSASDLGIPMVGVGLLYAQGYFIQRLDESGWQKESYFETPLERLPIDRATNRSGNPIRVYVETRAGKIGAQVWFVTVGRGRLVLLDSDIEENAAVDRELTGRLYSGDATVRIRQELLLGVGGVRALSALGIEPGVLHLNEGHSVFSVLEAARMEMASDGVDFDEAFRRVRIRTVFTTHTPVEAGHDRFDGGLVEQTLGPLRDSIGISHDRLMALGRVHSDDGGEPFCMTVLGLRAAAKSNGVAALHGRVSRRMWQPLWPGRAESEAPIGHVTNGVHVPSWLAPPMRRLYETYLGSDWQQHMDSPSTWTPVHGIDDTELWEAHQIVKTRMIAYIQRQTCIQEAARDKGTEACNLARERLDPRILTIGFARRFATYKRGSLILSDEVRLEKLVCAADCPIQIVFAGKAHPHDDPGKHLIQRIFRLSSDPRFMGRIVFLEDHDINVARHFVQGVDVWLNTPRRPREACGTSGMKALFNGVLNCSVLDGWWAEAYDGMNGFAVGRGEQHVDEGQQDLRDAEALYSVLEDEIVPLFYNRNERGIPLGWVDRMKHAIQGLAWRFNARRMVLEYATKCYLPAVGVSE